jgi:hypothetical protein
MNNKKNLNHKGDFANKNRRGSKFPAICFLLLQWLTVKFNLKLNFYILI